MSRFPFGVKVWVVMLGFVAVGTALAANGNCPNGMPYCFAPGSPAIADNINHNFAQLKEWLEGKVGSISSNGITATAPATFTNTATFSSATFNSAATFNSSLTANGASSMNSLNVTGSSGITVTNDLTARNVYQQGYRLSCAAGVTNYYWEYCCRISIRTGGTDCRIGSSSGWTTLAAPFSASANGSYSLSCAPGVVGLTFPFCCRINDVTGATECARWNAWVNPSWVGYGSPY